MQVKKNYFYLLFLFLLVANFLLVTTAHAENNAGSQAGIRFTEKEEAGKDSGAEIDDKSKSIPQFDNSHLAGSKLLPQTGSSAGAKKIISFLFILAGTTLYHQNAKQRKN